MNSPIDLRSDTVTRPTPAMRASMAAAEVGDDVFGEDPTVNLLQARSAELLGHEAALFCPTGTMGNQLAVLLHTQRGEEILLEHKAHIFHYELNAAAALSGVQARLLPSDDGTLTPAQITAEIKPGGDLFSRTGLVAFENTHNMQGGTVWPVAQLHAAREAVQAKGVACHLDGARVFNAALASGVAARALTTGFDSVMISLSKGLGCPAGALLLGKRDFITRARQARKRLGGGMRQVGILAAAGLHAFDHHLTRLADDHANAATLAAALAKLPGIVLDPARVKSNILIVQLAASAPTAAEFISRLRSHGVLAVPIAPRAVRFVTHLDFAAAQLPAVIAACEAALKQE